MKDFSVVHSLRAARELRQIRRRGRQLRMLVAMAVGVVLLVMLMELGRAFGHMQQVNRFVQTLSVMSPAEVTRELDRMALMLTDRNPLVQNAAVAAFTVATGLRLEGGSGAWWQWWQEHRGTWKYSTATPTNEPGVVSPHPYRSAFPPRR